MSKEEETRNTSQERSVLIVATLTSFMGPFMISAINVALPAIQGDMQMDAVQLSWLATSYLLATAILLLPAGKIADIHGRKKVFISGIGIYTVGSLVAAFLHLPALLICSRVVQGAGAALFIATGMAIISSVFPPQKRGRVIGIYVAAVYAGLSAGPFFGGYITEFLGWRRVFLFVSVMGVFSLWLSLIYLKDEWYGNQDQKVDWLASGLYGISIMFFVYGASRLPELFGIGLLLTGIAGLYWFLTMQRSRKNPLFDVELFLENTIFAFSSFAALLHYSSTFAVTFLLSLYLQFVKGMSPQMAGTLLMAQPVMMAVLSPVAGGLADRFEPRFLATLGMAMTVMSVLVFSGLSITTPLAVVILNLIFLGIGFALFSSPNMNAMMGAVEPYQYGIASGLVATMRLLGQMFSMAVATVALAVIVGKEPIGVGNIHLFLISVKTVFLISAFFCLIGTMFSWYRGTSRVP